MSESAERRKVYVAARSNIRIVDFRQGVKETGRDDYYVSVFMTDEELALEGEAFVQAARKALEQTMTEGNMVILYRDGPVRPVSQTQILGFRQDIDNIVLLNKWRRVA